MKKPGREGFGSDCWIGGPEEVAPQTLLEKNSHAGDLYEQLSVQSQWGRRCRRVLCLRADMSAMLQVMWNRFQHFLDLQSIKMYKPVSSFPLMHFSPLPAEMMPRLKPLCSSTWWRTGQSGLLPIMNSCSTFSSKCPSRLPSRWEKVWPLDSLNKSVKGLVTW